MTLYILPIVEGHTEVDCVERLLHRIWNEIIQSPERLQVLRPSRGSRLALTNESHPQLVTKVNEAYKNLNKRVTRDQHGRGALLILLDAENDCPAILGPSLLNRAQKNRSDANIISCVIANRMLENWIVAGASTLAGMNGLPEVIDRDAFHDCFGEIDGNAIENCNGVNWIEQQIRLVDTARSYKKTSDAKVFFQAIDLAECRQNSPSFDKLCRELKKWIQ